MATITFSDADGAWKLHNAQPWPASRFANWTPDSAPIGDESEAEADGVVYMFRKRSDYAARFDLLNIPSRRAANLVLQSENFGTTWAAAGSPTRSAAAHTKSGITLDLIGDDDAGADEHYTQTIGFTGNGTKFVAGFVKKGTSAAAAGSAFVLRDTSAGADRLNGVITFDADGRPVVAASAGTYLTYQLRNDGVYRLLFLASGVVAANTNVLRVHPAATLAQQGNLYVGGMQASDDATPTDYLYTTTATRVGIALSDLADRLVYHLLNGGNCSVNPADAAGSVYATCGRKPGTRPSLVVADKRTLEHTLSLHLLNVAASPARMVARYAGQ